MSDLRMLWAWLAAMSSRACQIRLPRHPKGFAAVFVGMVSLMNPERTAPDAVTISCTWVRPVKPKLEQLASNGVGLALFGLGIFILVMVVRAAFSSGSHSRGEKFKDAGFPLALGLGFPIFLIFLNTAVQNC